MNKRGTSIEDTFMTKELSGVQKLLSLSTKGNTWKSVLLVTNNDKLFALYVSNLK